MNLIKNITQQNISVSYLDEKTYRIAISELSILPKELIASSLSEFISNKDELEEMLKMIDLSDSYGFYSRLNVPSPMRGNKIGSLLLDETLKICAEQNIFLFNTVNPYGELSLEETVSFYERHGMKKISDDGALIYSSHLPDLTKQRKFKL